MSFVLIAWVKNVFQVILLFLIIGVSAEEGMRWEQFSSLAWAGPKKVIRGDRFIPDRSFDLNVLAVKSLRFEGFFDSQPDDVSSFLRQDQISRHLLGVSLEDGKKGKILFPGLMDSGEVIRDHQSSSIFRQREYIVEPGIDQAYDAPGVIDHFFYRTVSNYGQNFATVLESIDEETDELQYNIYLNLFKNEVPTVIDAGSSIEPITFMKWLSENDVFVGFKGGRWKIIEVNPATNTTQVKRDVFAGSSHAHAGDLSRDEIVGAYYLEPSKDLLVGFSNGDLIKFNLSNDQTLVFHFDVGMMRFEFSSSRSHLAIGTQRSGVLIYEWPSMHLVEHIPVTSGCAVTALNWHPERNWLAMGSRVTDHRMIIYSLEKRKRLYEADVKAEVTDIAWSELGTELVVALGDSPSFQMEELNNSILVWALVDDGQSIKLKSLSGYPAVQEKTLALMLDDRESGGRIYTRIRALALGEWGIVTSFRFSKKNQKKQVVTRAQVSSRSRDFRGSGVSLSIR